MPFLFDDLVDGSSSIYFDDLGSPPTTGTAPQVTSLSGAVRYTESVVITGVRFGASQGVGGVMIAGVAQPVLAWSDTSITIGPIARGTLRYGVTSIRVFANSGETSGAFTMTLLPPTGWLYVDLIAPLATIGQRIEATPDLVAGNQVAYGNIIPSGSVTVATNGSFVTDGTVGQFGAEVHDGVSWGAFGVQVLSDNLFTVAMVAAAAHTSLAFVNTPSGGSVADQFDVTMQAAAATTALSFLVYTSVTASLALRPSAARMTLTFTVLGAVTPGPTPTPGPAPGAGTPASKVLVANMVAIKLGAAQIKRLNDPSSKLARTINTLYDRVLDLELSRHWWHFAIARRGLPEVISDEPRGPYAYSYGKPADWLTTIFIGPKGVWPQILTEASDEDLPEHSHEGVYILTNYAPPAELVYIRRITDPSQYHATFLEVLACRLAMEGCDAITGSMQRWQKCKTEYDDGLIEARRVKALMNPPRRVIDDGSWLSSRY